jgi:hypothetical protein
MTEGEGESLVERRQRPVSVTTDVKALFNGGVSQVGAAYRSLDDSLGFAGPLSYHDPSKRSQQDYWQPPALSQPPPRADSDSGVRRDDPPVISEHVRQSSHHVVPSHAVRAVSARTQSLDITSLNFSRALTGAGHAFGPVPPSPGTITSSPNTATGQYFPGTHSQHALRANVTGRQAGVAVGKGGAGSMDSVTQCELGADRCDEWMLTKPGLSNVSIAHQ